MQRKCKNTPKVSFHNWRVLVNVQQFFKLFLKSKSPQKCLQQACILPPLYFHSLISECLNECSVCIRCSNITWRPRKGTYTHFFALICFAGTCFKRGWEEEWISLENWCENEINATTTVPAASVDTWGDKKVHRVSKRETGRQSDAKCRQWPTEEAKWDC